MPTSTLVPSTPISRKIQGDSIDSYASHSNADADLRALVTEINLTKNDDGYIRLVRFLNWQKNFANPQTLLDHRVQIRNLIKLFFNKNLDKEDFKKKWRDLVPNTDEHLSTQSMYVILDALKSRIKQSLGQNIDMDVVNEFAVAASFFRLPTIETGHKVSIKGQGSNHEFAHPRGPHDSMHIHGTGNPTHTDFDLTRRLLGFKAGLEHHQQQKNADGTRTLLRVLEEAVTLTTHWVASPYSIENIVRKDKFNASQVRRFFNRREAIKKNLFVLRYGLPAIIAQKQLYNASQYDKFSSPAARSINTLKSSAGQIRQRASTPSLERDDPPNSAFMPKELPFEI